MDDWRPPAVSSPSRLRSSFCFDGQAGLGARAPQSPRNRGNHLPGCRHNREGNMRLNVNGTTHEVDHTDTPLLWVLRDELGLTGTHYGCGIGICGSCSVLIDGVPARSCLTPTASVENASVTTLEGLARTRPDGSLHLHPVQQAFLENPLQCLWCFPGHAMTAVALIAEVPDPTPAQIDERMDGNYCRCDGYNTIREAVARAAVIAREQS